MQRYLLKLPNVISVNHKSHKKDRVQTLSYGHDMDLTPVNGEKMQRTGALCNVGAKFMSHIKVGCWPFKSHCYWIGRNIV